MKADRLLRDLEKLPHSDRVRLIVELGHAASTERTRPHFVHIDVPAEEFVYRYRLLASIALAEAVRQVGQRGRGTARARRQEPFYDSALALVFENMGETVYLDELELY